MPESRQTKRMQCRNKAAGGVLTAKQVLISRRDIDATRIKSANHGLTFPILIQKQWELSLEYGMFATPIGYLIDEQGVLLSDVAVGIEPILELARRSEAAASTFEDRTLSDRELVSTN